LEEKKEKNAHLSILEEELKIIREKDECIIKLKNHMHRVLCRGTHMLRGVLKLMNIINLLLEELEEKVNLKILEYTYLIFMEKKC